MKKYIIIALILISSTAYCQDYNNSVGVRTGVSLGVEYKRFKDMENAYVVFAGAKEESIKLTVARVNHQPFLWTYTNKLFAYWGFGAHVAYNGHKHYNSFVGNQDATIKRQTYYSVVGLDAVIGFEYRFLKYPFVVGVEYVPYFDVFGPNYFDLNLGEGIATFKYIF